MPESVHFNTLSGALAFAGLPAGGGRKGWVWTKLN